MSSYVGQMMIVCFLVDLLLILGTNSLCGYPLELWRAILAALYGGIYGGACLLSTTLFLNRFSCKIISLFLVGLLAFGVNTSGIRKCGIYILLYLALNGLAQNLGKQSLCNTVLGALGLFVLCVVGLRGKLEGKRYVPVELSYGDKVVVLTALKDTGNDLRDPVTGKPVLIIDANTAEGLTGLSPQQLSRPIETMGVLPGLRLIPCKTVGGAGLLLALRFADVKIGAWKGSSLVAFSPSVLSVDGIYQALTGGIV